MPSPMKFRRPADRGYSMSKANAENGAVDPTKYRGNHFCREDLVRPIKLAFTNKPVHSTTTLRLLSSPFPDPKIAWEPWRFNGLRVEDDALGDWIRTYRAARGVGSPTITYLMFDSAKGNVKDDFFTNPYWVLFKRCHDAKKTPTRGAPLELINLLTAKTEESYGQIPAPADMYMARGLVYERGATDKDGKEPLIFDPPLGLLPDDPRIPLVDLGPQLGKFILNSCDKLIDGVDEEELLALEEDGNFDWAQFFEVGDPVGLDQGVFWRAFPAKAIDPRETKTSRRRGASLGDARGGGQSDKVGYEAFYTHEFNGLSPDVSEHAELLKQRVKSWDEMLLFPSIDDQIAKLCSAIRARDPNQKGPGALVLNLFEWAWGPEYPEFVQAIPEELWDKFRARASVSKSSVEQELEGPEDGDEDGDDDGAPSGAGPKPGKVPDPIIAQAKKLADRRRAVVAAAPAPEPDEEEDEEEEDLDGAEVLAEGEPEEVEPEPAPAPVKKRKADAYREKLSRARSGR